MKPRANSRIITHGDSMSEKTNAIRLIEQAKLVFREAFYEYDENDLSGIHAANAISMPPEQVFKTLVSRGDRNGINVFCIPVCCELDLKKAAKSSGNKKLDLIPLKELLPVTGYIRGGCSPVGMKKHYPTFFDETCILWDEIAVSAGERGHQILMPPEQLVNYVQGTLADLI